MNFGEKKIFFHNKTEFTYKEIIGKQKALLNEIYVYQMLK